MKWSLLLPIRLYWFAWPVRWNRGCLFRETCSHHVYRVTQERGASQGLLALFSRHRQCRPGYSVCASPHGYYLRLADGVHLPEGDADPALFRSVSSLASQREAQLNAGARLRGYPL